MKFQYELISQKKVEDEQRRQEQHQLEMQAQKEQFENLMAANMTEIKREREAMTSQKNSSDALVQMMGDMLRSRGKEMAQLTKSMLELANRPPVVVEKGTGCIIS